MKPGTLLFSCMLALSGRAYAQLPPLASSAPQHALFGAVAAEPELVLALRYAARLPLATDRIYVGLGGGLKLPPARVAAGAFRVDLAATAHIRLVRSFGLDVVVLPYVARSQNDAGRFVGLGTELRLVPGWFPRWGALGADLGYQSTFATHIEHSAWLRDTFDERYPEETAATGTSGPHDGWYGRTSQRFRLGIASRWNVNRRWTLALALGSLFAYQQQGLLVAFAYGQIPVYLELATQCAW